MRLFIAVNLPIDLKKELASLQPQLKNYVYGSFVQKDNIHLTLKFLGEVSDVDKIKSLCLDALKDSKSFEASLQGIGAFPSENYIRVIWVGIKDGKELENIYTKINNKLSDFKDNYGFKSHMTLARVKGIKDRTGLIKFFSNNKNKEFGSFKINEIKLMKSVLKITGPEYSEVASFPLVL